MASQILPPLNLPPNAPGSGSPSPGNEDVAIAGDVTGTTLNSTVVAIQGNAVKQATYGSAQDGYFLQWVNANGQLELKPVPSATPITSLSMGGDVIGTTQSSTVAKLAGNPLQLVAYGPSQDGKVLTWNNSSGLLEMQAAPGSSVGSNVFVYRAGATSSGNVFNTFQDAYNAAIATGVPATIYIDDTITACTIPSNSGNFDLHQITLSGVGNYLEQNFLSIYDDITFNQGICRITNGLMLSFYGNTNPLITLTSGDFTTVVDNYSAIVSASSNNEPIFDLTNANASIQLNVYNTSCVGVAGAPIFNFGDTSTSNLTIVLGDYCFLYGSTFAGTTGSATVNLYSSTTSAPSFSGYSGALSVNVYPNAAYIAYSPANSSNWNFSGNSGVPSLINSALDSLASGLNSIAVSSISGVAVSGTPSEGQILTATGDTSATWSNPNPQIISGVVVSGTPSAGQVLTATSPSTANWAPAAGPTANAIQGYMSAQTTNLNFNDHMMFNNLYFTVGGDITLDGSSAYTTTLGVPSIGRITLAANHTYKLTFNANQLDGANAIVFNWRDANTGTQIGLQTVASITGSYGDVIGFYQTSGTPGLVELSIVQNGGITNVGFNYLPWFSVEEIA